MKKEKAEKKDNVVVAAIKKFFYNTVHYDTGSRPRAWELDVLRGILMIFVTFDHVASFGYQLNLFEFRTAFGMWIEQNIIHVYYSGAFRVGIQPFGLFTFALLSGISCSLSHSNVKRVLKMVIFCAIYMTVFALLHVLLPSMVSSYFIFNIINVLTICVILWWLTTLMKFPNWLNAALAMIMIAVGLTYYYMYFVRGNCYIENPLLSLLVYNGHAPLIVQNFEPLLPHMGFFFAGGVFGKIVYKDKQSRSHLKVAPKGIVPLALLGKNSLVTYLIAPIVILGLLWCVEHLVWLFL